MSKPLYAIATAAYLLFVPVGKALADQQKTSTTSNPMEYVQKAREQERDAIRAREERAVVAQRAAEVRREKIRAYVDERVLPVMDALQKDQTARFAYELVDCDKGCKVKTNVTYTDISSDNQKEYVAIHFVIDDKTGAVQPRMQDPEYFIDTKFIVGEKDVFTKLGQLVELQAKDSADKLEAIRSGVVKNQKLLNEMKAKPN